MEHHLTILNYILSSAVGFILIGLAIGQRLVQQHDKVFESKQHGEPNISSHAALIIPSKGMHSKWEETWNAYLNQSYNNLDVYVAFQDRNDPGFLSLSKQSDKNPRLHLLITGECKTGTQQNHNMNSAVHEALKKNPMYLLFGDNDTIVPRDWAVRLIRIIDKYPHLSVVSASRFAPLNHINFSSLSMAHLLVVTQQFALFPRFTQRTVFWGGSFILRADDYLRWNVRLIWEKGISDDIGLALFMKNKGLKALHLHSLLLPEIHPENLSSVKWYTRQLLNLKAHDYNSWFSIGLAYFILIWLCLSTISLTFISANIFSPYPLLILLTCHALANITGTFMYNWRIRSLLLLISPILLICEAFSFAKTLFCYSLSWSGRKYRFNRSGEVLDVKNLDI